MSNLRIKKVGSALHIITPEGSAVLPLTNPQEIEKGFNTLIEFCYKLGHVNQDLQKSLMNDDLVEKFDTTSVEPLYEDLTLNIPSVICKDIKKSMECAPAHLQGQILKSLASLTSRVYRDCSEQITQAGDTNLLAKSLLQKSIVIDKDLALLDEKLSEPLEKVKSMKLDRELRKSILKSGVEQGKLIERTKLQGVTPDIVDTAQAIVKAQSVLENDKMNKESAIKRAKKVSGV